MRNLELFSTAAVDHLLWGTDEDITKHNTPALSILTDFDRSQPLVIDGHTSAPKALEIMEKTHTYMRLVVDAENKFLGVITRHEFHQNMVKLAKKQQASLDDLTVKDLMIPRESMMSLDYKQLSTATVGDVVRALQENGLHHILVIDHHQHHIRGMISANDLARKLRVPIDIKQPPSFMHIFNYLS
ncbi:MAG: CBS domain-containing protein [Shewanella sp.]|nr:CBS domain-containing protein [Shewanella sp.]MCF1431124.1 CBS domain-containing protein [Shewanella sp.]MCF1439693.1 CBS domain-containing protein [Shewanella sp.]MCF1458667.1 CBS domain-containing protein [Shewanella sp.]